MLNVVTTSKGALAEGLLLLVDSRKLVRQCFEEGFRASSFAGEILAIADAADWPALAEQHPPLAIVFLYHPACKDTRAEVERAAGIFARHGETVPIVVLADAEDPGQVIEAIEAGANGFVPTSVSLEVAIEAMRLVMAGGTYIPANALIASRNGAKSINQAAMRSPNQMFTDRQLAVIQKLREGKANKAIAFELNMSESTVKVHIRNIMRKLRANNRTEAAFLYHALLAEEPTAVDEAVS